MTDEPDLTDTVPWRAFVKEAERRLTSAGLEHAAAEARWLVEEAAGFGPGDLAVRSDELATVRGVRRFDDMISRREVGEPIQYVLGHWPFRHLDLLNAAQLGQDFASIESFGVLHHMHDPVAGLESPTAARALL